MIDIEPLGQKLVWNGMRHHHSLPVIIQLDPNGKYDLAEILRELLGKRLEIGPCKIGTPS